MSEELKKQIDELLDEYDEGNMNLLELEDKMIKLFGVKRSVKEVEERVSFNNMEIEKWSGEIKKTLLKSPDSRDENYLQYCRELVSDLKSDNECIKWLYDL